MTATLVKMLLQLHVLAVAAAVVAAAPIDAPYEPPKAPLSVVPPRALFNPAPSLKTLRRTPQFRAWQRVFIHRSSRHPHPYPYPYRYRYGHRQLYYYDIGFCIDTDGRVVLNGARRGGEVGKILGDTLETWRFTPLMLDGEPHAVCAQQTFVIEFR